MEKFGDLHVTTIVNGPFVENCYLLTDATTQHAVLVDPGDEPEKLAQAVLGAGVILTALWSTHGHIDHVGAAEALQKRFSVPYSIHAGDMPWVEGLEESARAVGIKPMPPPHVDHHFSDGDVLKVGEIEGKVLHTPGHSLGGCCFYFPQQQVVFVGDTLFANSIGRTDFPGGSLQVLLRSIHEKLMSLQDDVVVFSGHGSPTTIGAERRTNRYLR